MSVSGKGEPRAQAQIYFRSSLLANKSRLSASQSPGIGAGWLGALTVFGFGDGRLVIDGTTFTPHRGGILGLGISSEAKMIFTCGDDGTVAATRAEGDTCVLHHDAQAWFDGLVLHEGSTKVAISAGRDVIVLDWTRPHGAPMRLKPLRAPTSVAFSGDGHLLAVGHSAGVSLFRLTEPDRVWHEFPCSGGPLSVGLDHSGDFLFAGLSEPALAGWRLRDGQGFRMGGYPGKPRQLVWSSNGKALLTTGGPALLVWPMIGKDGSTRTGPMGQAAGVYRPRLGMITAVATRNDLAVTGWSDGGVDLVTMTDGSARHLGGPRPPQDLTHDPRGLTTSIVSVAFRGDGKQVSWIGETGTYGTAALQ